MKSILSTKILSASQKELLLNAGVSFVDYDAISVQKLVFEINVPIGNAIVSSLHAAHALVEKEIKVDRYFVVGQKTTDYLIKNQENVVKTAENARELAEFIIKNEEKDDFYFFCGNRRRDEIPTTLKVHDFSLFEVKTYQTELNLRHFDRIFDGILFFSPSGVVSFTQQNDIQQSIAFCIGGTTGSEAKKHTDHVVIANSTSIESVIAKSIKTLVYEAH